MKTTISWIVVIALIVIGVGALIYWGSREQADPAVDAFAQCLTDKGFAMYGAYWCSHCQNEKRAFGASFKYINYVECTEEQALCTEKGISGSPTWISGTGEKLEGEQGLEGLARASGCVLPQ